MVVSCSEKKQNKEVQRDADGMVLKNGQFYDDQEEETQEVWICLGRSSHAYHSTDECYGIQACRGEIEQVSLEEALDMGRTPCHYCHEEGFEENDEECEDCDEEDEYDPDRYDSYEQYLEFKRGE